MICIPTGMIGNQMPIEDTQSSVNFFAHRSVFLTCKNNFLLVPEFSPTLQIFTPRALILTAVIDVCHCANCEMVTNNLTTVIEVALIDDILNEALLYSNIVLCGVLLFYYLLVNKTNNDKC